MSISAAFLPEFDHETANTRKALERIADDKLGWKPHNKSLSLGDLATHLANVPSWTALCLNRDSFDMSPPGEDPPRVEPATSVKAALDLFDKNVREGRAAIATASDEVFMNEWTLFRGGEKILSMPRVAVIRSFILNHMIHHRGQLTVYLRLNDIPVPAIYGQSADESG